MSVALMRIYDHFHQTETTSLEDEYLAGVAEFAAPFLGKGAVLQSLKVDKTEVDFDEDEEDRPRKKVKSEVPYVQDEAFDPEQGQPLIINWSARSSNEEAIFMDSGESGLDVSTVMVDGEVDYNGTLLRVRIEFTESMNAPMTTLVIDGTSAENFLKDWARDTWQPQLENIAVADPVLVCSSRVTMFRHANMVFPLDAGVSVILRAIPGENLSRLIEGPEPLHLYGLLLDRDLNWAAPHLKSFPFFQIALGKTIRLQGCFFEISTEIPEEPASEDEEDEADVKVHGNAEPFAQLNLGGQVWCGNKFVPFWTDVPADNEVLAFRLAGVVFRPSWTLDELEPLLAGNSAVSDTFALGLGGLQTCRYHITGMEYFFDLHTQTLYSLSIQLALLNTEACVFPGNIRIDLQQLDVHCNVGTPDANQAVSLWAEGIGRIGEIRMPLSISWNTTISMTADGEGVPPENLLRALSIQLPPPDPDMTGIADYQIEFLPPDGRPRLSMQPLYRKKDISVEDDENDDTPDGPIVLSQQGVVSWPRPLSRRRKPVPRKSD